MVFIEKSFPLHHITSPHRELENAGVRCRSEILTDVNVMPTPLRDRGRLMVSHPGCQPAQPASWYQPWGRRAARLRRGWCTSEHEGDVDVLLAACSANDDAEAVRSDGEGAATSPHVLLQQSREAALAIRVALLHKEPKSKATAVDQSRLALAEECYVRYWGPLDPKASELVPTESAVEALAAIAIAAALVVTTTSAYADVVAAGNSGTTTATATNTTGAAKIGTTTTTTTPPSATDSNPAMLTLVDTVARLEQCIGDVRTVLSPVAVALIEDATAKAGLLLTPTPAAALHGSMVQEAATVAANGRETVRGRRPEALHGCVMLDSKGTVVSAGYNHTVADCSQMPPELLHALPELQGMVGDHRQWQRAWDKRTDKEKGKGNDAKSDSVKGNLGNADARLSFHAEQHAVLQAAALGKMGSLRGGSCYIVELDNVNNVGDGIFAEAYPCSVCWPLVKLCGLQYVYFTTPSGLKQLDFGLSSGSVEPSVVADAVHGGGGGGGGLHLLQSHPQPSSSLPPQPPAFSGDRGTFTGIVKTTTMRKFGFIVADDPTLGDVFFPLCVLKLSDQDCSNPVLRQFPDGSPMLHAPFRSFLCGKRVSFQLEVDHPPPPGPSPHATAIIEQHRGHRGGQQRPKRPQASVVTPVEE